MMIQDQYTSGNLIPWPMPQNTDDSRAWRHLPYEKRMQVITQSALDWAHEEWMEVLA